MLRHTVRIEELRPRDIIARRDAAPIAYNAFGPLEWHSYHLPLGTDPLVGEALCVAAAEDIGGVVFPTYYAGLDALRTPEEKERFGLPREPDIVGMDYPSAPLTSEYWTAEESRPGLLRRFRYMRELGFRLAFLMTCHGGPGQQELAEEVAAALSDPPAFSVHVVSPFDLMDEDLKTDQDYHAEQRETAYVLGWRPELVDLTELPEGELRVADYGMMYEAPVIPPAFNPRHTSFLMGHRFAESMRRHFTAMVREKRAELNI
jgi:creatinine amidohydrolase